MSQVTKGNFNSVRTLKVYVKPVFNKIQHDLKILFSGTIF